jgi:hypothetical protein
VMHPLPGWCNSCTSRGIAMRFVTRSSQSVMQLGSA